MSHIHRLAGPEDSIPLSSSKGFFDRPIFKEGLLPSHEVRICTPQYMREAVRYAWEKCRDCYLIITVLDENGAENLHEGVKAVSWSSGADPNEPTLHTNSGSFLVSRIVQFQIVN